MGEHGLTEHGFDYADKRYNDTDDARIIHINPMDGYGCVHIDGAQQHVHIPDVHRQDAAQALAGDEWRVVPAKQPGPEPVSVSDLEPGDVVHVEAQGIVETVRTDGDVPPEVQVKLTADPEATEAYAAPAVWLGDGDATVRVLRSAEPEPDPEQVDLWADALSVVWSTGEVSSTDREVAAGLIRELRRRGVRVDGGERSDG